MSRPARASQADIKRAVAAAVAADVAVTKIEIDRDGNIAIYSSAGDDKERKATGWEDLE